MAGFALAVNEGPTAKLAVSKIVTEELESWPGADVSVWTFLLVYGSWFVARLGVGPAAGGAGRIVETTVRRAGR